MYDEMASAKSLAYDDGVQTKQAEPPRITTEMDALDKEIEIAEMKTDSLIARLTVVLRPEHDADVRGIDGTPTREPSQHAARLIGNQSRVRSIAAKLQDALERLEI